MKMSREWRALHQEAREVCCHNPFLERFKTGNVSSEESRRFAVQRYLKAGNFVPALAMLLAATAGREEYGQVGAAASRNLCDETGMWHKNEVIPDPWRHFVVRSHEVHRQAFYAAWGISQEELEAYKRKPSSWLETTRQARDVLDVQVTFRATVLELAGWLVIAEHVLPGELTRILRGLEIAYPDRFSDPRCLRVRSRYSPEALEAMRYARWYPEDHIRHDAGAHSQEIETALRPFMDDPESYAQIEKGARRVVEMNRVFYSGF